MYIAPYVSLVNFIVDGISAVMNREDVKDLKRKYPDAQIKPLRKGRSSPKPCTKPSAVRVIPVSQYMKEIQNAR